MNQRLFRPFASVVIGSVVLGALAGAQSPPSANPTFEVASVKPNKSGDGRMLFGVQRGGRFTATNVPARELIRVAYGLQSFQLIGGPAWLDTDRFDVVAKADGDLPPPTFADGPPGPMPLMIRALLAERFHLAVHNETRELAIYALVLARTDGRLGPQLRQSEVDCAAIVAAARARGGPPAPQPPGERPNCGFRGGPSRLAGGGIGMGNLAATLSWSVGRTVLDRTELPGEFDFTLEFTPDQLPQGSSPPGAPAAVPPADPNGPSIFTALQEQLGLKLESTRGPVEVLVIDGVEQPTPD